MKKILSFLTCFVLILGCINICNVNNVKADEFIPSPNPIIVEGFVSNLSQTNGSDFQHYARAKFQEKIVFINYHVKDNFNVPENLDRQTKVYQSKIYPNVFVNGTYNYPGYMIYDEEIEKAITNKNYPIKIQIKNEQNQEVIKLRTNQKIKDTNLIVLVYEDEVWQIVDNTEKDYFHRYVVRKMLSSATGDYFIIQPDLTISKTFKNPIKLNRQMGIIAFVQNPNTKVIYGSGHIKVSENPITTLHWNYYNPNLVEFGSTADGKYVNVHTGYDYMIFRADVPNHLKSINMAIDTYSQKDFFELSHIIPTIPNTIVEFNKTAGTINIIFPEEISSNDTVDLFKLVVKFKKTGTDIPFPVYKLFVNDTNNMPIGWEYIELKYYYFNEIIINPNPLDFNEDNIVDKYDLKEITDEFGRFQKDKSFEEKYDVFKDGRIDIQDVLLVERETWIYDPPK